MISNLKGKSEEEVKAFIDNLSQSELQDLIKEGKTEYQALAQQKAQIEAEYKITKENYEAELSKLKELGISSIEELDKAIENERNSINSDLFKLVSIINEVN